MLANVIKLCYMQLNPLNAAESSSMLLNTLHYITSLGEAEIKNCKETEPHPHENTPEHKLTEECAFNVVLGGVEVIFADPSMKPEKPVPAIPPAAPVLDHIVPTGDSFLVKSECVHMEPMEAFQSCVQTRRPSTAEACNAHIAAPTPH